MSATPVMRLSDFILDNLDNKLHPPQSVWTCRSPRPPQGMLLAKPSQTVSWRFQPVLLKNSGEI
jgi:hypothetical protein